MQEGGENDKVRGGEGVSGEDEGRRASKWRTLEMGFSIGWRMREDSSVHSDLVIDGLIHFSK